MRQHAKRDIVLSFLSVCPFNADVVAKRLYVSSNFF